MCAWYGPAPRRPQRPAPYCKGGKGWGMAGFVDWNGKGWNWSDTEKEWLVERVKQIQRTSPDEKEKWWAYCDSEFSGCHDPNKLSAGFLRAFIEAYDAGGVPTKSPDTKVLRLRGLPFSCHATDVATFLADYCVDPLDVVLTRGSDGRPTGEALVDFRSVQVAMRALEEMQHQSLGNRYIELFKATGDEFVETGKAYGGGKGACGWPVDDLWEARSFASMCEVSQSPLLKAEPFQAEKEVLVEKVKKIQRMGEGEKQKWWNFCSAQHTGCNDPNKHSIEFLQRFLEAYEVGGIPEDPQMAQLLPTVRSRVLRLRGLPFSATTAQVAAFLSDYNVSEAQVVLVHGVDGRLTGEAYAAFHSTWDGERAHNELQRQPMGSRYIELFRASEEEWHQAQEHASGCAPPTLKVRGLPFKSTAEDVAAFFSSFNVSPANVVLAMSIDGRPSEAFVHFSSETCAAKALQEKSGCSLGGRPLELYRARAEEVQPCWSPLMGVGASWMNGSLGSMAPLGSGPLGLPFGACILGAMGVCGGFGGLGLAGVWEEKDWLVEQVKNIQRSGACEKQKWREFCALQQTASNDPAKHDPGFLKAFLEAYESGVMPEGPVQSESMILRLRGVPFQASKFDIVSFLSDYQVWDQQVHMGRSPDGRPSGEAFVAFDNLELASRCLQEKQGQEMGNRYIEVFRSSFDEWLSQEGPKGKGKCACGQAGGGRTPCPQDPEKDPLVERVKAIQRISEAEKEKWWLFCDTRHTGTHDPKRHSPEFLRRFLYLYDAGESMEPTDAPEDSLSDGRVVRLRGLPFSATTKDVVQFLAEYEVNELQCVLGFDGRVTGEAFAIFPDARRASMALKAKQRQQIGSRYIELFAATYEEWTRAAENGEGSHAPGDPIKDALVTRVKEIQRASEEAKQKWWRFCDAHDMGNYDPARHTSEFLQSFITMYQVFGVA